MVKQAKISKTLPKSVGQFPVIVQEDVTGGYWVSCPIFEGCYSQGETIDEALVNIEEAITLCVEELPKAKKVRRTNVSLHMVTV